MEHGKQRREILRAGLAAALALVLALPAAGRTLRTIAIDGDLDDWTEVLLDRPQTAGDQSLEQGDPDAPGQAQRDLRGVAATWDPTNLYLYFARTGSGTNSLNAVFYLDVGHDGLLDAGDRVAFFKFTGSNFGGLDLYEYVPLAAGGDPIPPDGTPPDGDKGAALGNAGAAGAGDPSGIRFEVSIPWALFTASPGEPIFVRGAISSNQNIPAGLEDNVDPIDTFLPGVSLSPGRTRGAAPGRTTDFAHRVVNTGTGADVIDLSTRSLLGFRAEIWSDPNGDGDPADGLLVAADANGDGDFTDALDTAPPPGWDANFNRLPDGGVLAPDASRDWVLRVEVPASQALDTEDTVRLAATSDYRSSVRRVVHDHVRVGLVTVTPPGDAVATANFFGRFAHEACNGSGLDRTLDLVVTSLAGWPLRLDSDPNGDGDPADGAPLTDTDGDGLADLGLVPDGECRSFVLSVSIPPATPAGASDEISVVASDGALTAAALDLVDTLASRVELRPDRSGTGQRGKTLYFAHQAINAADEVDSFTLNASSALGAETAVLDDPDGDGRPADSTVVATTGAIAPDGGVFDLVSRVRIADTAVHGDVDTVTLEALSDASAVSDRAFVTVDVAGLLTYSDPLFARPANEFFGQCGVVHALAFQDAGTYIFNWLDPVNGPQRTSAELAPYSDGSLDDFFDLGGTPSQGVWTVQLLRKSGTNWVDLGPEGLRTFEVIDLVAAGARISEVETGADIHDITGEDFVGYAELDNPTEADILGSRLDWVAFFDANGDGLPTAGEDWLQPDGTIAAWAPGFTTASRGDVDVLSGEVWFDRFDVGPVTWSQVGGWTLWSGWTASCGFLLSEDTVPFTVGCEPEPVFGGLASAVDVDPCAPGGVQLSWPPAVNWGVGTGGTYAVWRSEDPAFLPSDDELLVHGLNGTGYLDGTAVTGTTYYYVVQAESDVSCSTGPNNDGLLDGNLRRFEVVDQDLADPPVAAFAHSAPECWDRVSGVIDFQDLSAGPAWEWSWDFDGDGLEDANGPAPSFDFPTAGTYDVRLTVRNPCGEDTVVRQVVVTEAPTAVATADRAQTCLGEAVDFDGSASSAVGPASLVAWSWDFDGDGVEDSSDSDPPPFSYAGEGAWTAHLLVTDSEGCTHETNLPVIVNPALGVGTSAPVVDTCTGQVAVTAAGSGGLPPYSYDWDVLADDGNGTGSGTFPPGSALRAIVTVTDAAGCTAQAESAPFVIPRALAVDLSQPLVNPCTGLVAVRASAIGGTPPYSYSWDSLTDDGSGLGTGTFAPGTLPGPRVTVTDAEGCTVEAVLPDVEVPPLPQADFSPVVSYQSPGVFTAQASAIVTDAAEPWTLEWDLDDDGDVDSTLPDFDALLGANEDRPLRLTITDANGCVATVLRTLSSGGCPVDVPLERLMVRKGADGVSLVLTWDASTHPCHGRYRVVEAASAEPALRPGTWPSDPQWSDLQAEDADMSEWNEALILLDPRAGENRFFLVRDGGTDGTFAPTLHYGNDSVGP